MVDGMAEPGDLLRGVDTAVGVLISAGVILAVMTSPILIAECRGATEDTR
jgi:hypothetical protein